MIQFRDNDITQWSSHIQEVCGNFNASFTSHRSLFIGEIQAYQLGKTEIAFIKSNADYIMRTADSPDRAANNLCFLVLQYSGKMQMNYKGGRIILNEGDMILLDPSENIEMYPQGLFSHISVHLSRDKLAQEKIHEAYFGKLITKNMSGFLLKNIVQNLSIENIQLWYAEEDGNAFEDALIALLKPTIHYKNNYFAQENLKDQAERYIIEHLAKPELSPRKIADALGISLRHLYRLFNEEQLSLNKYIQQKRLERVKIDLLDACFRQTSITELALKWGFGDSAHFSKIFKKTYGISPKECRQAA
ncbi:transcriptional regulator FeaR [Acinetobacter sp. MB5]|uniref:transcriptional regulator FeaR n=1 Tax=Acinetobacter sp. MB5 TaxID=2069438 RepID=UPI000DD00FA3|nr:transcriptional regulator FeaR [Acinetobacter sp. MB5]